MHTALGLTFLLCRFSFVKSRQQINLPAAIVKEITANLEDPSRDIFGKAQDEVFHLMERDVFPRFLKSQIAAGAVPRPKSPAKPSSSRGRHGGGGGRQSPSGRSMTA